MLNKILVLALALVSVQISVAPAANAQLPGSCFVYTIWYWPDALPLGFFFADSPTCSPACGQGPYSYWIAAINDKCTPPKPEVCPFCPSASKPISLSTGNTYIKETDISIPGLGGGLSLSRTWNSIWPASQTLNQIGWFGTRWKSNFDERVFLD